MVKQGDVYMCNLSRNNVGHEQSGVRPVLVVSADIRNENSNNVFVFPITHARKKFQPCHYILSNKDYPFFMRHIVVLILLDFTNAKLIYFVI